MTEIHVEPAALLAVAERVLAELAGPAATLRPDQLAAARRWSATDVGCCRPGNGLGQVGRLLDRGRCASGRRVGSALVVSPLLALMRDQVAPPATACARSP